MVKELGGADMNCEPCDLDSLYAELEKAEIRPNEAYKVEFRLREIAESHPDDVDLARKARWEMAAFSFVLQPDGVKPRLAGLDENGAERCHPAYDADLGTEGLEYILQRLQVAQNPMLRARYAHVLWCGPKKHEDYAKVAVEAYLELVRIHEKKDNKEPGKLHGLAVLDYLKNAHGLCKKGSEQEKAVLAEIGRVVCDYDHGSASSFALRLNLIEFIIQRAKHFSEDVLSALPGVIDKANDRMLAEGRHDNTISMLKLGEKLARLRSDDPMPWRRRIAERYEALTEQRKDDGWVAQAWCLEAIKIYRSLNDKAKVKELEAMLPEIVRSAKLHETVVELDGPLMDAIMKECQAVADSVSSHPGDDIVKYLMLSPDLLPQRVAVERMVDDRAGKFEIAELFPIRGLDLRGNVAAHCTTPEEKRALAIMQSYGTLLNLKGIRANMVVIESVRKGNLSADTVLDFIRKQSWLGMEFTINVGGPRLTYRWTDAIEPGIREYFSQVEEHIRTGADLRPILAVDSLTMKIEGMLRELCALLGGTTSYQTRDHAGRTISREKDIDRLLRDEVLIDHIDEDTMLFFRFLLVDQSGYKLRHNIAHALQIAPQYTLAQAHFLFLAILRLARYQLPVGNGAQRRGEDSAAAQDS